MAYPLNFWFPAYDPSAFKARSAVNPASYGFIHKAVCEKRGTMFPNQRQMSKSKHKLH